MARLLDPNELHLTGGKLLERPTSTQTQIAAASREAMARAAEPEPQPSWVETRPVWQKAIDVALPGGQFRTPPPAAQFPLPPPQMFLPPENRINLAPPPPAASPAPALLENILRKSEIATGAIRSGLTLGLSNLIDRLTGYTPPQPQTPFEKGLAITGEMVGALGPIGGISKGITWAVPKLAGEGLLKAAAREGVTGALYEAGRSAIEGQSPQDIARNAVSGGVMFGAGGPAGELAGRALNRVAPQLAETLPGRVAAGAIRGGITGAAATAAALPLYSPEERPTLGQIGKEAGKFGLFEAAMSAASGGRLPFLRDWRKGEVKALAVRPGEMPPPQGPTIDISRSGEVIRPSRPPLALPEPIADQWARVIESPALVALARENYNVAQGQFNRMLQDIRPNVTKLWAQKRGELPLSRRELADYVWNIMGGTKSGISKAEVRLMKRPDLEELAKEVPPIAASFEDLARQTAKAKGYDYDKVFDMARLTPEEHVRMLQDSLHTAAAAGAIDVPPSDVRSLRQLLANIPMVVPKPGEAPRIRPATEVTAPAAAPAEKIVRGMPEPQRTRPPVGTAEELGVYELPKGETPILAQGNVVWQNKAGELQNGKVVNIKGDLAIVQKPDGKKAAVRQSSLLALENAPLTEKEKGFLKLVEESGKPLNEIENAIRERYNNLLEEELSYLKSSGRKGVAQGNLIRDEEGNIVGRYGRVSNNPEWYRRFYQEHGRAPSQKEMRELATKRLKEGYTEEGIEVPPNDKFNQIDATLKAIEKIKNKLVAGASVENKPVGNVEAMVSGGQAVPKAEPATTRPEAIPAGQNKANVEAMAARPETPPAGEAATATEKPVTRKVMIDRLMKALDLPARVGRINIPKALGIFKRHEEVIRTKLAEDMPVIAHEAGHHLDKMFRIREIVKDPEMVAELVNLGKTQPKNHFTEGIAEFMRHYLTGDDAALKKAAPKFYDWFEATARQEPEVWDALQQFRQDYKDYTKAPAKARVKAAISVGERQSRKVTIDRIMEAAVDDLRPIDSFVQKVTGGGKARKGLAATEDPFVQAWLFRGWTGKARNAIWYGVRNKNGEKVAPGLMEILKPVAKNIDDFRAYIVSRRAIELHARGKETGLDPNDVEQVVAELDSPEFRQTFDRLKQYQDAILDRLVESGIISGEQKDAIRKLNQEYVPFYRVFDPNAGGIGFGKRGFGDLSVPIKRLKGSGRTIVDPLESIIKNTYYMINLAERNNVGRPLVDFANKYEGMGKFVEKVDPKVHPISFNLGEIKKYLEQVGVDLPPDALQEVATVFRPNMTGSAKENILTVWRNGKPELYQLDPDLYRAVLMLDRESTNTLVKLMSYPASWLRAGAVLNPEFAIRNMMRDAFGSWVFSKYGFVPGLDTVRGLFHVIKRDDLYQQWLEGGGASATLVSLDRAYLQEDLRKLLTKDIWQKMKMYARHPLEVLRVLSEFSEEATRVGEFAKGVRAETKRGVPVQEAIQKAALASRDITLDFSRAGTVGRPANQLIAFFNASLQGIDKTRRAFKERPMQTMFKVLPLTLASIALWAQNYDKPEYQQLPQWRKDLFWNFIVGDHIVSIPKPFELGVIFCSLPERVLDWTNGVDPEAVAKWANSFKENVTPNWIPTALLPIIETMSDYSFFQGRPLTPMGEKYLLKQEQYGPTTTEAAKGLSRLLAAAGGGEASLSPRQIENLVRGYTGGLGMHGMAIASAFMPKEYTPPAKDISEYPGIKAVLSRPFQGAEGVNDFYNRLEELEKKARTAKKYQDAGRPVPANLDYDQAELTQLRRASDALAKLRKEKEKVLKSALSPKEKRTRVDALNIQSINIAQKALGRAPVQ